MKAFSFLCVLSYVLISTQSAQAYSSSHFLSSEDSSSQMTVRSKPAYPQFASVSFLKSDATVEFTGTLDVKSQCAALGYIIPVETCTKKKGKYNGKEGYYYSPSKLCSEEDSIAAANKKEAAKYTTQCCDMRLYTADENDECPINSAKLSNDFCYWGGKKKYRCACDRGRYQYSTIAGETCGLDDNNQPWGRFNANLACMAYEPRTQNTEFYFISCCPKEYKICKDSNHEVGRGNECRALLDDPRKNRSWVSKYEQCPCASHYDKECDSDKIINRSFVCQNEDTKKFWTFESNCESSCSKTIETNIDSYLYKSSWHCLYRKDGAIVRDDEDLFNPDDENAKEGYCGMFDRINAHGDYDECVAQGFTKSPADCYNQEVMLICPNDATKVWCLDGKYCTGYDVGGTIRAKLNENDSSNKKISVCEPNAKVVGFSREEEGKNAAKVDFCVEHNDEIGDRCRYKYDAPANAAFGSEEAKDCNKCWADGVYNKNAAGCLFTETGEVARSGKDSKCCNDGYYMLNGVCTRRVCDRTEYPYEIRPPYDAGDVEECREGDPTTALGYKAFFGYTNCKTDASKGEMWINDPANNRRCICARHGEGGRTYALPFTVEQYYMTNGDSTNLGFNAGYYGMSISCTDADGSYYGYTTCYLGRTMGTGANYGTCRMADVYSYCNRTTCAYEGADWIKGWLHWNGLDEDVATMKSEPRSMEESFCVNKYTHCESKDGTKLGDDTVCGMVPAGCNLGIEAECNRCYHVYSVYKGDDGLYHKNDAAHRGGMTIVTNSCRNTNRYSGVETCPTGFKKCGGGYGCCYKYCYDNNPAACVSGDILATCPSGNCVRGNTLAPGSVGVAHVYYNAGGHMHLLNKNKGVGSKTWDEAQEYVKTYAPDGLTEHPIVGVGHWKLPVYSGDVRPSPTYQGYYTSQQIYMAYYGPAAGEGWGSQGHSWTSREGEAPEDGGTPVTGIRVNMGDSDTEESKSIKRGLIMINDYTY